MYPTKRRRLADTASTLTKPFRSPLTNNVPTKQRVECSDQLSDASGSMVTSADQIGAAVDGKASTLPCSGDAHHTPDSSPVSSKWDRAVSRTTVARRTLSSPIKPSSGSEYLTLQKQHSALTLQLKHLATSVDTSAQALKILESASDADLERLIQKWRATARDVAEELFGFAKDRVNKMGGVGAWREKYCRSGDSEENPWGDGPDVDEDELTEEQKEQLHLARDEARQEAEKYGLLEKPRLDVGGYDDDSFTMDMMLKQLNVTLDVIGYDAELQRWSD